MGDGQPSDSDRELLGRSRALLVDLLDELRPDLLRHSGRVRAEAKADGTPVTAADVETNRHLVDAIAARFPDHGVVSEELETRYGGERVAWVIDPIDGTSNFTAGLPYWCVSVAVLVDGYPALAVVDAPAVDARYEAEQGAGATRNGEPIRVSARVDWTDAANRHIPVMLTTTTARRARGNVRLNARVMGSAALDLCAVAEGVAACAVSLVPKVWDVAAGALLVTEAGGAFVTLDGPPLLPVEAGLDYRGRSSPCVAGPDESYARELAALLRPPR